MIDPTAEIKRARQELQRARFQRQLHNVRLGAHGQMLATSEPIQTSIQRELEALKKLRAAQSNNQPTEKPS